jgi:hypothetical protein
VLSDFTRGALRFPRFAMRCRMSSLSLFFLAVLLVATSCLAQTQSQDQTPENPSAPAASSSSTTPQQTLETQRGLASRRALTRQRREAQAITDTYTHRWEVYTGGSYMRFRPGPHLHNSGTGSWTLGFTRYFTPRFGITADARGYYGGTSGITNPYNTYNESYSVFPFTIGPQYRFYGSPKFSVSSSLQGGIIYGYFDADTNGHSPQSVGLYPASVVAAGIFSINVDYNLSPGLAVRVAPHVLFNGFGSQYNHNQGLLVGLVYRWGRQ